MLARIAEGECVMKKRGFTIIELLTIMSIIIIIIGMLVPALNRVKRYARRVTQKNQFHAIDIGLNLFNAEWESYPPSDGDPPLPPPPLYAYYCGANKLAEAMVGQDLQGFHPSSRFVWPSVWPVNYCYTDTDLSARRDYLTLENANACSMENVYSDCVPFDPNSLVLCDMFLTIEHRRTGRFIGMPILYYKANVAGTQHPTPDNSVPFDGPGSQANIYKHKDNDILVGRGMPAQPDVAHPLFKNPMLFYENTWDTQVSNSYGRPYRRDSYILLSAGFDGFYGTADDVFNFGY